MSEYQESGKIGVSAMKADLHPQTARKYVGAGKPPDELQVKHNWRTREDPLEFIWPRAESMLVAAPELEAKELFGYLRSMYPDQVAEEHLRTFQRRIQQWRLEHGKDHEVFFPQEHVPGRVLQLDWTHAKSLGVTIRGQPLDHLLCHAVLPYSNWEWATRCQSESMLSLRHGLQEALHQLGWVTEILQMDNSSTATHRLGGESGRDFNPEFLSLVGHYRLEPQTINLGCPNENGDVESLNGHLKKRLKQHLLLRGSSDFGAEEAYDNFVIEVLRRANRTRTTRLAEEIPRMRQLPPIRLSEYDELQCPVSHHSTIRVKKVVYSVPARLIGHEVKVEVYEAQLKIYHGRVLLLTLKRALGERRAVIDYRHVIEHLVRKPGAFTHYVHREELFPDSTFRLAYDRLVGDHGLRAGELEYLRLLQLAAQLGGVNTIGTLVGQWCSPAAPASWRVADLRRYLDLEEGRPQLPDIRLEPDLSSYDTLLVEGVAHVG
jgi:hypothetical protein